MALIHKIYGVTADRVVNKEMCYFIFNLSHTQNIVEYEFFQIYFQKYQVIHSQNECYVLATCRIYRCFLFFYLFIGNVLCDDLMCLFHRLILFNQKNLEVNDEEKYMK